MAVFYEQFVNLLLQYLYLCNCEILCFNDQCIQSILGLLEDSRKLYLALIGN